MKLLVTPKDDNNPYQALLYNALRQHGVEVTYFGLTKSHTVNQLLLPLELLGQRFRGARIVHLHYTDSFIPYGADRFPLLRWVGQAWFTLWLYTLRLLGIRLIWTAHNVLPMGSNFGDPVKARRRLVAAADLVIAHSQAALDKLASLDMVPRRSVVIPHGPYTVTLGARTARIPGSSPGPRRFLFFGVIAPYKGVDDLLAAYAMLPAELPVNLVVAGECRDPELGKKLLELAGRSHHPIDIRFGRVDEEDVSDLINDSDVAVLPYRESTTSGSAMLMLTHGRPLVVPDLPSTKELPDGAIVRYDGTVQGLSCALGDLAVADADVLGKMADAGHAYCASISWESIARRTFDEINRLYSIG